MADTFSIYEDEWDEELVREFDRFYELNIAYLEAEVDHEIDGLVGQGEFDMANTLLPETFAPWTTAGASSVFAPSTPVASGVPDTDLTPSMPAETFVPLESQRAAHPTMGSTERLGETERAEEMAWMGEMAQMRMGESHMTDLGHISNTTSNVTADATLDIIGSFPVVATNDLPEGYHDCPICQETFEDEVDSEAPVRLPC